MGTTSPFRISHGLGPDLHQVVKADQVWYEGAGRGASGAGQVGSPQLGVTERGDDGRTYMWVEASATIAVAASPGTQVTVTVTGPDNVTVAAGSGGWYAPNSGFYSGTIAAGDRFWVAKGTAP
ncbi:hypothetical protein LZK98_11880 [Sphingomonas cannabina]|uniref:hypothetical protein n=1 Tax=Sphingomonas cannabina TaxID=2899123 RepID=UPI001F3C2056|nr:hypothetical protein [Sphingomonas cannabina]UIJ43791.1 hypothetical protein LZK98_11880 [Sphingomonas cannabina]